MITGFTRFTAIAVAAAGIMTAQTATAGALFTYSGNSSNDWHNPTNWTDGVGYPDQTTEDAHILAGRLATVTTNVNIGGIQGEIRSQVAVGILANRTGSLTLNGIAPGGTTPFTSSSLDRLSVARGGIFANSGASKLTIKSLDVSGTGRFRNTANALGRVDLEGGEIKFSDNAEMDNQGTLELRSFATIQDNAIINNRLGGTFTQTRSNFSVIGASQILNDATFSRTGGNLNLRQSSLFLNSGSYTQTSGTTTIDGASTFNNTGIYRHNGGATNVSSGANLENSSLFEHNDGALTVHAGSTFSNIGDAQINGGTVQVNAGGTLDGVGFTTLNGGTLRVNGETIQTGFGGIFAGLTMNGGTLAGSGTVRANVVNLGGIVGPGNSPGTLTVDGDYTQGPGGTLAMEIASLLSFDVLDITGSAALDGILDLSVDAGYAAAAQDGDTFTIIEWDSFSGAFATVNGLNFAAGKFFTLDYGTNGLTLTVNAETVVGVAEPGMIALFGLGIAGIGFTRRRRG